MIQLNVKTEGDVLEQFKKVCEEHEEIKNAIIDAHEQNFEYSNLNEEVVRECFDKIQTLIGIIRKFKNEEGYKKAYKEHLLKLQSRAQRGEIKLEYFEL